MSKRPTSSDSEAEHSPVPETIDIDFEFFSPAPLDYHSLKLLLSQLLSHDAASLDLGSIADLILAQNELGSCVKTDGEEGDPYAVLSVLNLNTRPDHPALQALSAYLLAKASSSPTLQSQLASLLASTAPSTPSSPTHLGLILSERLVNMPSQLTPPLYRILADEITQAIKRGEEYNFSHLIFLSRVFVVDEEGGNAAISAHPPVVHEERQEVGKDGKRLGKKKLRKLLGAGGGVSLGRGVDVATLGVVGGGGGQEKEEIQPYHPEDEFISTLALDTLIFPYTSSPTNNEGGRGKDSFGVETRGQLMLLEMKELGKLVEGLETFLSGN